MNGQQQVEQSIVRYMLLHPTELAAAHKIAFPSPKPKGGLTARQRDLLNFIRSYTASNGTTPSYEEMTEALGLRSKSGIARILNALEERGFIGRRRPGLARSAVLLAVPE